MKTITIDFDLYEKELVKAELDGRREGILKAFEYLNESNFLENVPVPEFINYWLGFEDVDVAETDDKDIIMLRRALERLKLIIDE